MVSFWKYEKKFVCGSEKKMSEIELIRGLQKEVSDLRKTLERDKKDQWRMIKELSDKIK